MASRWPRRQGHLPLGPSTPRSKEETTMTQTQGQTPQYHMMTLLPSPANRLQPSSSQTCDRCPRAPLGAVCSLMHQLQVLFENHGVCSCTITDCLVLERVVYEQRALAQPLPTALQLVNRQKGFNFLSPAHSQLTPVDLHSKSSTWRMSGPTLRFRHNQFLTTSLP